jgi:polysaccharide export outer membrane protein
VSQVTVPHSADAGADIYVVGEVNRPGIISFAPGEPRTLLRAIFRAGGCTAFAKRKAVRLVRTGDGGRVEREVNLRRITEDGHIEDDLKLQSGDMIIVPQKFFKF